MKHIHLFVALPLTVVIIVGTIQTHFHTNFIIQWTVHLPMWWRRKLLGMLFVHCTIIGTAIWRICPSSIKWRWWRWRWEVIIGIIDWRAIPPVSRFILMTVTNISWRWRSFQCRAIICTIHLLVTVKMMTHPNRAHKSRLCYNFIYTLDLHIF